MNNHFDTLISNVDVFDGRGNPAQKMDIALVGERLVAMAEAQSLQQSVGSEQNFAERGQTNEQRDIQQDVQHIDGTGLALAPGFIDVHTHDDTNVIRDPNCLAKISQGVTTVIVGNCGISASPASLTQAPPDPMNLLGQQQDFQYPQLSDYVRAVNAAQPAVNVAALVGHTTLRNNVMNDLLRVATEDEIEQMKDQLKLAMEQGALGLSSGLAYGNAFEATSEEVIELAKALHSFGGIYTTHLRNEFEAIIPALKEAAETGLQAEIPIVVSHLKCAGAGNWGRSIEVLECVDSIAKTQSVACDCYPYSASSSTLDLKQVTDEFEIFITWSESLPELAGQTLQQIAKTLSQEQGQTVTLLEAARALQPAGAVYHCMEESDVQNILQSKHTMIGSDGLPNDPHPHPRLWGAFPRVLGHYAREQQLFPLAEAIHKMTGLSAERFGLQDRGVVAVGAYADLVLFDPNTIQDAASFEQPKQVATGIVAVFVNGHLTYQPNQVSELRKGRFLPRSAR